MPKAKTSKKTVSKNTRKPINSYDKPSNLVIGGLTGLVIFYLVVTRALGTGSYWEYFFSIFVIIISIRMFIRAIRLK